MAFGLPSFNPWSLAPLLFVPVIFAAGAWWDGDRREDNIRERVARDFNNTAVVNELACMTDKAQAWEEVRNGRQVLAGWMARFERIMEASDAERAAFKMELAASARQVKLERDRANETMARLDDARGDLETAWREGRIPRDITCRVLKSPGCPDLSGRPAGAANDGAAGVQPGPAGSHAATDSAGGGAAMSAGAGGNRSGDPRGEK